MQSRKDCQKARRRSRQIYSATFCIINATESRFARNWSQSRKKSSSSVKSYATATPSPERTRRSKIRSFRESRVANRNAPDLCHFDTHSQGWRGQLQYEQSPKFRTPNAFHQESCLTKSVLYHFKYNRSLQSYTV